MILLPQVASVRLVTDYSQLNETSSYLLEELVRAWERADTDIRLYSARGKERLALHLAETEDTAEAMSDRLRNGIPKYGEALDELDYEAVVAAFRKKKGN